MAPSKKQSPAKAPAKAKAPAAKAPAKQPLATTIEELRAAAKLLKLKNLDNGDMILEALYALNIDNVTGAMLEAACHELGLPKTGIKDDQYARILKHAETIVSNRRQTKQQPVPVPASLSDVRRTLDQSAHAPVPRAPALPAPVARAPAAPRAPLTEDQLSQIISSMRQMAVPA